MNIYEEYLQRSGKKSPSKEASVLFGILNMLESEQLLNNRWKNKTPEQKSIFMEDVLSHFSTWEKNLSSVD